MEWNSVKMSKSEFEKKQRDYIKEALALSRAAKTYDEDAKINTSSEDVKEDTSKVFENIYMGDKDAEEKMEAIARTLNADVEEIFEKGGDLDESINRQNEENSSGDN